MYIIISITVISFVGILSVFFYRFWELKSGRVVLIDSEYIYNNTPEKLYNFFCVYSKLSVDYIMKNLSSRKNDIIKIVLSILNWQRAKLFKNIINGKKDINGKNSGASLYLKDITEHKKNIKPPATNH